MINLIEYLDKPTNLKVFFKKPDETMPNITYNHYGVIAKETLPGNNIRLIKENGEALINWDNVNQIITL